MTKINLPVILLKGIVLLPHNEIRLEFDNNINLNIIDSSKLFHDSKLLVVSGINPLADTPLIKDLPKIGVIAKIKHILELPNGKTRIIIKGLVRAKVLEYIDMHTDTYLESIVEEVTKEKIDVTEENLMVRKLYREVQDSTQVLPYMSNSILSLILGTTDLDKMTDIIVPNLPISYDRILNYLNTINASDRANMVLKDIYEEKTMYDLENKIDAKVKMEIDNSQKEYYIRERIKAMREELNEGEDNEPEIIRQKIAKLKAPKSIIERLNKEIKKYETTNINSPEKSVIDNYIHWLLELPWSNKTKDNDDLKQVKRLLNKSHYGLEDVKLRIIEYLAVKK